MDSPTYIANATRTESVPESIQIDQLFLHASLEMSKAMTTIMDQIKRKIYYGAPLDTAKIKEASAKLFGFSMFIGKAIDDEVAIGDRMSDEEMAEGNLPKEIEGMDLNNINIRLLHAALGCFTESGELLESIEKQYVTGELDTVNFGEEIGDIEWYQAIGFDETGVTEASCREKNIAKLRKRYPEKFDADQAVNRDLAAERKELERGYGDDGHGNDCLGEDQ